DPKEKATNFKGVWFLIEREAWENLMKQYQELLVRRICLM
ncbi:hypothetical protein Tco_1566491, partial [Tanacetum coccineum]